MSYLVTGEVVREYQVAVKKWIDDLDDFSWQGVVQVLVPSVTPTCLQYSED